MPKRVYADVECVVCHENRPRAARGMCRRCYNRWQKTGSVEYKRQSPVCTVPGCDRPSHSSSLCSMHWQRQRRTGEIGAALPTRRIAESRTSHEMYQTWDNARRRDLDPAWADFDTFVAGIGERPSRKHRLVRKVLKLPLGPNNFEWRAALISKLPEETKTDFNRRYKAAMREQFGHGHREHDLLGKYGLTLPKLAAMAEAQNHKCAICGDAETTLRKGRPVHLAVDHDHKPGGKVRALLCVACNTGLGKFRDDPELLLKAVAYLVKHREAA